MQKQDWRAEWETHADAERDHFDARPVSDLLRQVQAGQFGGYYNLWPAIAARAILQEAGWILFEILTQTEIPYLDRYHCAAALLRLMGQTEIQPVQLASERQGMDTHLPKLKALLLQTLELTEKTLPQPPLFP